MLSKIIEGERFKSPFSETIFKVKKIYTNKVLLEAVGNKNYQLFTEKATLVSLYEKVENR